MLPRLFAPVTRVQQQMAVHFGWRLANCTSSCFVLPGIVTSVQSNATFCNVLELSNAFNNALTYPRAHFPPLEPSKRSVLKFPICTTATIAADNTSKSIWLYHTCSASHCTFTNVRRKVAMQSVPASPILLFPRNNCTLHRFGAKGCKHWMSSSIPEFPKLWPFKFK
eukprot:TRINITY_DN68156_c4_g4_i1.p2 TRINITY_DN68156_c4_g4~~TRINITY_DN68156_c4_g4_i1.p2  ORF type:complete len:167 (+),score=10.62 TRINITY_DN68156_c4_g4_i1:185-685(+)